MPHPTEVLVIGGGLAATALTHALRSRGFAGPITVAGAEAAPPYDRPPLTKALLTSPAPSPLLEQFPAAAQATWRAGHTATSLDPLPDGGARVTFEGARALEAPCVVVATGARPLLPPAWDGVLTISTWEDAEALRTRLASAAGDAGGADTDRADKDRADAGHAPPGSGGGGPRSASVGIVGGGWLGLELASSLAAAGHHAEVTDIAVQPLGTLLPPEVGRRIARWLADAGVTFHGGHPVTEAGTRRTGEDTPAGSPVTEAGEAVTAAGTPVVEAGTARIVTDGREAGYDVVVGALGARPGTEWLPADLLTPGGHVAVDGSGRTARAGVWAVGDASSSEQHWNAAVGSAQRCAAAILGQEAPRTPPPVVFSTMFGRDVDVVGWPRPDLAVAWRGEGEEWTALLHEGGTLHAGVVVGRPRDVADLRRLLADGPATLDLPAAVAAPRLRSR